jgi:hypothetical protein
MQHSRVQDDNVAVLCCFLTAQCAQKDQPVRSLWGNCACNIWECRVWLWNLSCRNKADCSTDVHMDLNLRCLANSTQLQTSMTVATMRQVVLLISRTAGAWALAAALQATASSTPCKYMHDSPAAAVGTSAETRKGAVKSTCKDTRAGRCSAKGQTKKLAA